MKLDCLFPVAAIFFSLLCSPTSAGPADEILNTTGVKGGLVVHVGCGDGHLTAALRANESYLVHGLHQDPVKVEGARRYIQSLGAYGPVSVDEFDGNHLPYVENLVKLLIVSSPSSVTRDEILRVLCPGGVAVTLDDRLAITDQRQKPWPDDIDQWTHWMHDAGNSGVARDTRVGPPRRMQWVAEPLWDRGHEVISSVGAVVTANGRIFSAVDEGQTAVYSLPSKWMLVARDAFSGVLLWKRPMPYWNPPVTLGGFTRGFQPQRLVTDGRRVYLPTGERSVLTALDAATGSVLKTLDSVGGVNQILCDSGLLVAVTRPDPKRKPDGGNGSGRPSLVSVQADTFEILWTTTVAPSAIALASDRVIYWAGNHVVALDAKTGTEVWRTPFIVQAGKNKRRSPTPTLRVCEASVYVECASHLAALSVADGTPLWERKDSPVSRGELFVSDGLLWRPQGSMMFGHDPANGEIRKTVDASNVFTEGHHPRCYPCKATERYVITNNRGAEFVSLTSDSHVENDWLRGSCGYGIVPANGLLYAPPNPCFCYPGAKITGFNALAPKQRTNGTQGSGTVGQLTKGPAYGKVDNRKSAIDNPTDWPTYRHDAARSGAASTSVSTDFATRWTVDVGGRITPPVVCGGRVYVASKDAHTLSAMAADDGRALWRFTAGGRVDSPPSVFNGLVLFGCADGRVYCVRANDGALVWRFQAAPSTRRIVAFGQLESPWRVHGNVLIHGGLAYFTAGRSSFLDGGLLVFALKPATGEVVYQTKIDTYARTRDDARKKPFVPAYHIEGAQSDILTSQGGFIYLGQVKFDAKLQQQEAPYVLIDPRHKKVAMDLSSRPFTVENESTETDYEDVQRKWVERTQTELVAQLRQDHGGFNYGVRQMGLHVLATSGFLDDAWFNRTFWMYSDVWPGFYHAHRASKAGQLLVVGPKKTYAVQAFPSRNLQSPLFTPGDKGYLLVADDNGNEPFLDDRTVEVTKGWGFTRSQLPMWFDWAPIRIRGMVLAGRSLFVAGPPDVVDPDDPMASFEGRKGGTLRAYASADGKQLVERHLDTPPVFDGLIAAENRLFLSTTDGKIVCFGGP